MSPHLTFETKDQVCPINNYISASHSIIAVRPILLIHVTHEEETFALDVEAFWSSIVVFQGRFLDAFWCKIPFSTMPLLVDGVEHSGCKLRTPHSLRRI